MQRLFNVEDLSGHILRDANPELAPEWYADFERVVASGTSETLIRQAGHDAIVLQIELLPLLIGSGDAVFIQMWDVTKGHVIAARPAAAAVIKPPMPEAERQMQQVSEAQHRVRNLMSMIRSVARLSAPSHLKVDDYVDHLVGRLQAMGRTQSMLARAPGTRLDLAELIDEELLANVVNLEQCLVEGSDIALAPQAAEIVSLAIHELATNSIKFGALGDKGDIRISWTTSDRDQVPWLTFIWRETSPRRAIVPLRRGFGTCLIEDRIAYELDGEGQLDVQGTGVLAQFAFPLT